MSKKKINALQVREVLDRLAAERPERVDRRADNVLIPKYVENNEPACIVAQAMYDLGISLSMIKQLDREVKGTGGVVLRFSQSLMRRRFTDAAWMLMDRVQRYNDRAWSWGRIMQELNYQEASLHPTYLYFRENYPWILEIRELKGSE